MLEPLQLEGARKQFGSRISDEELLLRLTMPEEQVNAMLTSPPAAARPRPLARPERDPVVTLLREVAERRSITHFRVQTADELVEWRRAP